MEIRLVDTRQVVVRVAAAVVTLALTSGAYATGKSELATAGLVGLVVLADNDARLAPETTRGPFFLTYGVLFVWCLITNFLVGYTGRY